MGESENDLEKKYKDTLLTIKSYPEQFRQAWEEVKAIEIPEKYKSINNVVFCGMGGSALGARIVDSLVYDRVRVPFEIYTEYKLPFYAYQKTLVIVSSYSGSTEETLTAANTAIDRQSNVFGITTGGKLADILREKNIPSYIFDPVNNPSKQPRMSIGYASGALLSLFNKLEIISITDSEVENAVNWMKEVMKDFDEDNDERHNLAKKYARSFKNRSPILVASEHLLGTAHTIKNQFNESAKTFSTLFDLPELNHHLMEGLKNPAKLRESHLFFFVRSNSYSERVVKRYPITSEVVEKNGFEHLTYSLRSEDKLSQVLELLAFGSFCVYYLAKDYEIDPSAIPWVDYFKEQLNKI